MLFVIYINDLPKKVRAECKLYADDNKLLPVRNEGDNLQSDINSVVNWTKEWLLRLNKCKVMHLGRRSEKMDFKMEDLNTEKWIVIEETKCGRSAALKANRVLGMLKKRLYVGTLTYGENCMYR